MRGVEALHVSLMHACASDAALRRQPCKRLPPLPPPRCRDKTKFQWEDGSPAPPLVPSNQAALESASAVYSHWALNEPNNFDTGNGDEVCVTTSYDRSQYYYYFTGNTALDVLEKKNFVEALDRRHLRGWADYPCGSRDWTNFVICESASEHSSTATPAMRAQLATLRRCSHWSAICCLTCHTDGSLALLAAGTCTPPLAQQASTATQPASSSSTGLVAGVVVLAIVAVAACAAAAVMYQRLQAATKGHTGHADAYAGVMSAGALGLGAPGMSGPAPQPPQPPPQLPQPPVRV